MTHKRLFIPGPTEVEGEILEAMATPMIGHRSGEFKELYEEVQNFPDSIWNPFL